MARILNFLLLFLLVGIFVFFASPENQFLVIVGALLSLPAAVLAFYARWLSLDGVPAATLAGSFTVGFGGFSMAFILLIFFVTGSLFGSMKYRRMKPEGERWKRARRSGLQVWANGFWLVLSLALLEISGMNLFLVAGIASVAAATSDTWATEWGSQRIPGKTWSISDFREVAPGTNGGISLPGTAAGLLGSAVIAGTGCWLYSLNMTLFLVIFLAGFLGSLLDSYLGATIQPRTFSETNMLSGEKISKIRFNNDTVNWAATGIAAFAASIINGIII